MKIEQHKLNGVHLSFDNGFGISTIWGRGSYSENHDKMPSDEEMRTKMYSSDDCEVYFTNIPKGGERLVKSLCKKYNKGYEHPIGYLLVSDWVDLIVKVKKWKSKKKG